MFGMLQDMDDRGKVLNVAFSVGAAFALGDHLGFTAGFSPQLLFPTLVAKLLSGAAAVALAMLLTKRKNGMTAAGETEEVARLAFILQRLEERL